MIPNQPCQFANLSKLLLMPMSMDGDIVCFTGYLDLLRFFAHGFEVSSKNLGQQNGISSNKVVSSREIQGVCEKNTAAVLIFSTRCYNYPTKWAILVYCIVFNWNTVIHTKKKWGGIGYSYLKQPK